MRAVHVVLVLALAPGCAHLAPVPGVSHAPLVAPQALVPTAPLPTLDAEALAHVRLIAGPAPGTCEVIGLVEADARPGEGELALSELRARAAALGADAVVHVRMHVEDSLGSESVSGDPEWEAFLDATAPVDRAVHVTGEAVRFHESMADRQYTVLARIGVMDRVGREREALARLAARARAMHADLVVDVEVTHHAADEPFEVHGTAIRFVE